MKESLELGEAKKIIGSYTRRLKPEPVALADGLFRLPSASVRARKPQPGYDQSARDGFVIHPNCHRQSADGRCYKIEGEIAAGNTAKRRLQDGTACRIMTGALIPAGGSRVIAQEDCRESGGSVWIPESVLERHPTYIRRRGCEIEKGKVVVRAGELILPGHLVSLAATGHADVLVHRRPKVGFFCTGSELVASPSQEEEGLKVSGNHYLLNGLIRLSGGVPVYLGTVADTEKALVAAFLKVKGEDVDMILTTGGVGPGKYDLLEEAFGKVGGKVIYRSLNIRPGKSTLFGLLGKCPCFGLPGPPPAVSVLFNELVRPALLFLQGMKKCSPPEVEAYLLEPIVMTKPGPPCFKGAVLSRKNGRHWVRLAEKIEVPDGYMLVAAKRRIYRQGDTIKVHLVGPNLFPG
jgi:molybdopterin molybdotransferase